MDYEYKTVKDYSFYLFSNYFETFIYTAACFFLPLFLGHQQLVVGTVVNALLILSALNLKGYKLLPIIIAPSLGALASGLIFGPFTIFLVYMVPFIWIGNTILVSCIKKIRVNMKKNYLFALIAGAGLKSLFLFLSAFILYSLGILPAIFLTAMGILQLITAISGGIFAFITQKARSKLTH
jgi:hypothetical protein